MSIALLFVDPNDVEVFETDTAGGHLPADLSSVLVTCLVPGGPETSAEDKAPRLVRRHLRFSDLIGLCRGSSAPEGGK